MRPLYAIIALTTAATAQDIAPKDTERDPVLSALLREAESAVSEGSSVTADLVSEEEAPGPILVTGSPPDDVLVDEDTLAETEETTTEDPGGVRVEVEAGSSSIQVDAAEIKLLAPFPAKQLSNPPGGWKLIQPQDVPQFSREVELANGNAVTLTIRPHVLVPDADGDSVFGLCEPGFDPAARYAQKDTIGAVLADSIMSLDSHSDRLGEAAKRLDELLTSLPAPTTEATPISQP